VREKKYLKKHTARQLKSIIYLLYFNSYIIVENLRYLLYQYRPQTSVFMGHRFASNYTEYGVNYNAGGSYILSKKILEKFVTKLMHNSEFCRSGDTGAEDLELGRCLENSTIYVDTRDELNQKRFFPVGVEEHLRPFYNESSYWYDQMIYYPARYGSLDCCSDVPIQFHYIPPVEMYLFEYLIYTVHPYGVSKNLTEQLPRKLTFDEILKRSDVPSTALEYIKHTPYHIFEPGEKY
jgi:glycoprotein-N-acetylgalactosamine 3-beta-galactosyltransferase